VASFAGIAVGVSITIAPPALPVYVQPAPPGADYIWTPGYWAWGDDDYYWVPGTWVLAPTPGYLWTPGYWGWDSGAYLWHAGYWGPHVGFYGGVNYGFGYGGVGFQGAYWRSGHVVYNRSVTNVTNIRVTNVYNKTVVVNNVNHVSFNGGAGGLSARPNAAQLAAAHDRHVEVTSVQRQHAEMAAGNHELRASVNGGRPQIAATERPNSFSGRGVVAARAAGGPVHAGGAGPRPEHAGPDHGGPASAHPGPDHGPGSAHVAAGPRADRPPTAFHANGAGETHGGPSGGAGGGNEHGTAHLEHAPAAPHANAAVHPEAAPHPDHGAGPAQRAEHAQPAPTSHLAAAPHVDRPVSHEPPHAQAPHPQPQAEHHAAPAGGPGGGNPHGGGGSPHAGGPAGGPHPGGSPGGGGEHPGGGHPQAHEGGHGPNGGGGREEHR
jgi:hypothetical protein